MKSKETENKNNDAGLYPTAEELIAQNQAKQSIYKKIWFYLTCWRPVTKYELTKREFAWLKVGVTCLNNHVMIEKVITNMNRIVVQLQSSGMMKENQEVDNKEKKDREGMYQ